MYRCYKCKSQMNVKIQEQCMFDGVYGSTFEVRMKEGVHVSIGNFFACEFDLINLMCFF